MRCRGHGISYNISVAIFGGATPIIATALISWSGSSIAPAVYAMILIGTVGLAGVLLVPETKGVSLRSSVFNDVTETAGPERIPLERRRATAPAER
jgi:MHS family proline/betaine transporter-like MFS transporter